MTSETLQSGKLFKARVNNVDCTNGKSKSRLYFRNSEGEVKHVNVKYQDCQGFKVGDIITIYENADQDWYEIAPVSLRNGNSAM